jgi:hypothetical protein
MKNAPEVMTPGASPSGLRAWLGPCPVYRMRTTWRFHSLSPARTTAQ